jgi:pilus assembly protein CpaE
MVVKNELRSDQKVDVLLVTRDADLKEKFVQVFSEKDRFSLRVINGRAMDFEHMLQDVPVPELLIIDLDNASFVDTEALERIKRSKFENIPLVVISHYLDQDTVRSLVRIKVEDWLPSECSALDIYKSCERALKKPVPEVAVRDANCYSFFPVSGGCGNTTLAIQAAFLLAKRAGKMESTCLVDLNFQDGTVADYLDLTPSFRIEELALAPGRLDRQLLDVMLSRHPSGLSVLATPRTPARFLDVSEGIVASVLGLVSKSFDTLVVDLPKNWYPWTDNVMWGSNKVFVVSAFTVPALRQARLVADAVASKANTTAEVSVIINKYHEPLFRSGLLKKDAERVLGSRLGGIIPDLGTIVLEAINRGLPLSEVSPGSKLEKRLQEIVLAEKARK